MTQPYMRPRRIHELKTHSNPYWLVVQGYKTFEYRKNDRGYLTTDLLLLQEYDPETNTYTGHETYYEVTYVLRGSEAPDAFGIPRDYCIMSIKPVDIEQTDAFVYAP